MLGWVRPFALVVALWPAISRADNAEPRVDLSRIVFDESGARAPLGDGEEARLTIDSELQKAALRLLAQAHPIEGAVTLIDARTGHVLVWAEIARKREGSVILRARQPAASVFKLVTTAALLEGGEVTPETRVCTDGGNHRIERRHLGAPHGGRALCAPFGLALGHSRNAAYAQLATKHLSRQELIETAERIGFNRLLPFDAPTVMGTLEVPVGDLDFARTAAGFQGSTLSPLGAAELSYVVATGGLLVRPTILAEETEARPFGSAVVGRVLSQHTSDQLRRMMEVTVREGTSAEAFADETGRPYLGKLRVAGKTGTLQPSRGQPTASWFTGFAPSRRPEIVLSVLLVNGKVWRRKANEVARDMLRVYFHDKRRGITSPFEP